jgi:hypothetical protein
LRLLEFPPNWSDLRIHWHLFGQFRVTVPGDPTVSVGAVGRLWSARHFDVQKRRDFWRERAGTEAERWNWKAMRIQMVFAGLQALFVLLLIVTIAVPLYGLEPALIGLELFAGTILCVRLTFRHLFYRAARTYCLPWHLSSTHT